MMRSVCDRPVVLTVDVGTLKRSRGPPIVIVRTHVFDAELLMLGHFDVRLLGFTFDSLQRAQCPRISPVKDGRPMRTPKIPGGFSLFERAGPPRLPRVAAGEKVEDNTSELKSTPHCCLIGSQRKFELNLLFATETFLVCISNVPIDGRCLVGNLAEPVEVGACFVD